MVQLNWRCFLGQKPRLEKIEITHYISLCTPFCWTGGTNTDAMPYPKTDCLIPIRCWGIGVDLVTFKIKAIVCFILSVREIHVPAAKALV